MSQYLMLIYTDERSMTEQESAELTRGHGEFMRAHQDVLAGGNALEPTETATSVRPDGAGGFTVTDGAFTETKEVLGGYYLVDAPDLDAAIAIAKAIPAPNGGVEVRPIRTVTVD